MSWNYNFVSRLPEGFTEEDMLFIRQLGIEYTYVSLPRDKHNLKDLKELQTILGDNGLKMRNMQSNLYTFNSDIALGTDRRDDAIKGYIEFIEMLSEVGVKNIDQTMLPFFIYSSNTTSTNRFCTVRNTDINAILNSKEPPLGKPAWVNPDHEDQERIIIEQCKEAAKRGYSKDELWDNFAYFMDKVMPVFEKCNMRMELHPNDPPCYQPIMGVDQLITSFDDYLKAFEIAKSDALAMSFCCGCWLEGGSRFGNLIENLEWALANNKVEMIHFRNVSGTLPNFDETFLDNGYYDMYNIMRTLRKYNYQGLINPDHVPVMVDGGKRRAPLAYSFGFMRAQAMHADAEFSGK